jgi:predicted RNA-binding protein YlqC (UPF0109 family)
MKEFLEHIIKHLVGHPDNISIETSEKDDKLVFNIRVHENDLGQVIGKKGRTVYALRTLLSAVAAKEGKRTIIEIIE